jgi:hypothetical protein
MKRNAKAMIEKSLTLSTAHMPSHAPDFKSVRSADHEYGYILFVADVEDLAQSVPQWLRPIYSEALMHSCSTINFDCDANQESRFASYEW